MLLDLKQHISSHTDIESHKALISYEGQLPQPTHYLPNGTGHTVTQCQKRTRTQIQPFWAEPRTGTTVDATVKKRSKVTQTPVTATVLSDPKRHEIRHCQRAGPSRK